MKELLKRLDLIPDAYDDFILAVINYAKQKREHIELLINYIDTTEGATSTDVLRFIVSQPDFWETNCEAKVV